MTTKSFIGRAVLCCFLPIKLSYSFTNKYLRINNFRSNIALKSHISIGTFDPIAAQSVIDTILYPPKEYSLRKKCGDDALGIEPGEVLTMQDERLFRTYAEFPIESFEKLVDRALMIMAATFAAASTKTATTPTLPSSSTSYPIENAILEHRDSQLVILDNAEHLQPLEEDLWKFQKRRKMVDIGSGCGRLVLYAALIHERWDIHGVEISEELDNFAQMMLKRGVAEGFFRPLTNDDDVQKRGNSFVSFHAEDVMNCKNVLEDADLIFVYSTALPAPEFSEELGALLLGGYWSAMLAEVCQEGCVVITTDRVLNPKDGFVLVDRLDVENPDLLGSTGYIHVLKKN